MSRDRPPQVIRAAELATNGGPPRPRAPRLDAYPAAPADPQERSRWMAERNAGLSRGVPPPASGTFGKGDVPK